VFIHIIMSEEIGKREKKTREHISKKKKKSFSRKKILNMIFFIIVIIFVALVGNRTTKYFLKNRAYDILMKAHSKVEEDKKITNYYEKKVWDIGVVRETWRKDNNFLIKDTKDNGIVEYNYYIDGNYYILTEAVDDINNKTTKYATVIKNIPMSLPNLGLNTELTDSTKENYYRKVAEFTSVGSVNIEGLDCYEVYMRKLNDIYFVRKSDNRIIREIKYIQEDDGTISTIDTGVIEVVTDNVTDNDVSLPDLSGYVVEEKNYQEMVETRYNQQLTQENSQTNSAEENSNQ